MKKEFLKIAKEFGVQLPTVRYEKPEKGSVIYYISIYKNDELVTVWNGGYFADATDVIDSKEGLLNEFREFLISQFSKDLVK